MRTTSMILAAAALLAASFAALPAHALDVRDLPIAKAPETCPHEGPGFVRFSPGGPCTRISGRVRAEAGTPVPARPGAGLDGAARGVVSGSGGSRSIPGPRPITDRPGLYPARHQPLRHYTNGPRC